MDKPKHIINHQTQNIWIYIVGIWTIQMLLPDPPVRIPWTQEWAHRALFLKHVAHFPRKGAGGPCGILIAPLVRHTSVKLFPCLFHTRLRAPWGEGWNPIYCLLLQTTPGSQKQNDWWVKSSTQSPIGGVSGRTAAHAKRPRAQSTAGPPTREL